MSTVVFFSRPIKCTIREPRKAIIMKKYSHSLISFLRSGLRLILLLWFLPLSTQAQTGWSKGYDAGIVVSATEQASQVGVDIMKAGGNAIDASIAVHFALAVTFPAAGNIGGGGFLVVRHPDGSTATLDFRETAPNAASRDMYLDTEGNIIEGLSLFGHLASGIPGSVDGMIRAWERYGSLPWKTLIEPSIRLAREGFPLGWQEANGLNRSKERFSTYVGSRKIFVKADGNPWIEGDLFKQEDLARTLERIAHDGRNGFYSGVTAQLILEEMARGNGIITQADLDAYQAKWRDPVILHFKDYRLITMGPPSSGGIVMGQILGMIEDQDLQAMGFNSAATIHLMSEAMRRAYADRSEHLGDSDFYPVPQNGLLDPAYLKERMASFDENKASLSQDISPGKPITNESEETTHFSVVDPSGMAVSVTTTINGGYGSYVTVDGAGFLLNNEMDDFSSKPGSPNLYGLLGGEANAIEPGKRMLSAMTPTIVEQDGELRMVLGTPGGSTIITTVLQTFLNMGVFGMNAQQAVAAPRMHHQWMPDRISLDPYAFSPDTIRLLEAKGHTVQIRNSYVGRADVVFIDKEGRRWGGADPRGEDVTRGF
jgi:gamma-glutamyltranspeptidase / glutathione hydrolase